MAILVTGADGFVGKALCDALLKRNESVRCVVHQPLHGFYSRRSCCGDDIIIKDIGPATRWADTLRGVSTVIHLAAWVHRSRHEAGSEALTKYREVNTAGTIRLAREARRAGVRRFIFVSTVKVHGDETFDAAFSEESPPDPHGAYAVSKWEAECGLRSLGQEPGFEPVILRPCLIFGPGVKGNFLLLMKLVKKGIPLPFKDVRNKRSLLYLDNFIDALYVCIHHPRAAHQEFLISDDAYLSTAELIYYLEMLLNKKSRLFPFPQGALESAFSLVNKKSTARRLLGSLVVNSDKIRRVLQWRPPYQAGEGLKRTCSWYQEAYKS